MMPLIRRVRQFVDKPHTATTRRRSSNRRLSSRYRYQPGGGAHHCAVRNLLDVCFGDLETGSPARPEASRRSSATVQ